MTVSCWLGFSTAVQGNLSDHLLQFVGHGGFSKKKIGRHLT